MYMQCGCVMPCIETKLITTSSIQSGLFNLSLCVRGLQLPLPGVSAVYTGTLNMLTTQEMNNLKTYYSLSVGTLV